MHHAEKEQGTGRMEGAKRHCANSYGAEKAHGVVKSHRTNEFALPRPDSKHTHKYYDDWFRGSNYSSQELEEVPVKKARMY